MIFGFGKAALLEDLYEGKVAKNFYVGLGGARAEVGDTILRVIAVFYRYRFSRR